MKLTWDKATKWRGKVYRRRKIYLAKGKNKANIKACQLGLCSPHDPKRYKMPFDSVASTLLDDHHGRMAMFTHAVCRAAKKEPCDARVPLATQDDQVDLLILRKAKDFFRRMAVNHH